jgi:hypothetical protein
MKKVLVSAVVIVSMLLIAGTVFASPKAEKVTYTGYLMDKACSDMGMGMDGSDVVNAPWDHTKMCLTAEPCKASGYGVSVKEGSGPEYTFIKFDSEGDELAWDEIENTSKEKDFEIEVEGVLDGDILVVSSITLK